MDKPPHSPMNPKGGSTLRARSRSRSPVKHHHQNQTLPTSSSSSINREEEDKRDEGKADETTTTSHTHNNWHSRKISWGKDTFLGQADDRSQDLKVGGSAGNAAAAGGGGRAISAAAGRGVSLDLSGNNSEASSDPFAPQQLPLEEEDTDALQAAYIQSLFAGAPPKRQRHISSLGNIDLRDILKESPIETEAETYILRAIEEQDPMPNNNNNATSGVGSSTGNRSPNTNPTFPNIPDDAVSALSTNGDDDETDGNHLPVVNNTKGNNLNLPVISSHAQRFKHQHRRNQTMEQQLSGLASAIDAMQMHSNAWMDDTAAELNLSPRGGGGSNDSSGRRRRGPVNHMMPVSEYCSVPLGGGNADTTTTPVVQTSAETFQRNASLLLNRGKKRRGRKNVFHWKSSSVDDNASPSFADDGGGSNDHYCVPSTSSDHSASKKNATPGSSRSQGDSSSSRSEGRLSIKNLVHHKKTDGDDMAGDGDDDDEEEGCGGSIANDDMEKESKPISATDGGEEEPAVGLLGDIEEGKESGSDNNESPEAPHPVEEDGTKRVPAAAARNESSIHPQKKKRRETVLVRDLQDFFEPQKTTISLYFQVAFLYIGLPLVGVAFILFYVADCPPTGRLAYSGKPVNGTLWNTNGEAVDPDKASTAWWLLFVIRQIVTFTLAKCTEKLLIDYLTIRSRGTINVFGPWVTLFILQSKGWPSTTILWSVFNFCLLSGPSAYAGHWLFWQDYVGLFNEENPSGSVVNSALHMRILAIALGLGLVVSVKRLLLGLYLGKRTFNAYADQLAKVMNDILMISEVAALAKDFEREMRIRANRKGMTKSVFVAQMTAQRDKLYGIFDELDEDGASVAGQGSGFSTADRSDGKGNNVTQIIDPNDRNLWSGALSYMQQQRIIQLLGAWEEPVLAEKKVEYISVSALLQFRRSMACLHTLYPFSGSFGLADSREKCIQSAQEVYWRLLLNDPDQSELNFETLALLGLKHDGSLDQAKLKELIRLFRPDRDGSLNILHFVKSIDRVYKEIRMLRASVANASKIDKSFETIINWIFYAVALTIILSVLNYSPMALFLSISGVILAFAFMIGPASSKYFEGLLFILVQRPYAIGDGIHVMGVEAEGMYSGHPFWYVEDVTLFTTSVMYMYTGERATLSNGSLANSRIINSSRSAAAWMYILLKFPVNVTHERLKIFNSALEQFFKNRPREWRSYDSFRACRLDAQAGFIEYMVVCTHRNSWYEWVAIHVSKADLIHFCMELAKQLDITYRTPAVPVDLTLQNVPNTNFPFAPALGGENEMRFPLSSGAGGPFSSEQPPQPDLSQLQAMFPARI